MRAWRPARRTAASRRPPSRPGTVGAPIGTPTAAIRQMHSCGGDARAAYALAPVPARQSRAAGHHEEGRRRHLARIFREPRCCLILEQFRGFAEFVRVGGRLVGLFFCRPGVLPPYPPLFVGVPGTALCEVLRGQGARCHEEHVLRSLTPEAALRAAQAALQSCARTGYQVAVAVSDRAGHPLVMLRDRLPGPHTPETAMNKAYTAVTFKMDTLAFARATQATEVSSGIRELPRVVAIGGGLPIDSAVQVHWWAVSACRVRPAEMPITPARQASPPSTTISSSEPRPGRRGGDEAVAQQP